MSQTWKMLCVCRKVQMGKDVFDGSIFLFSNQTLLILTTILFGLFVISEIIGGIVGQ
jgi:hypothetical protein